MSCECRTIAHPRSLTDIGLLRFQRVTSFIPHRDNRTVTAISEPDLWDVGPKRNGS